MFSTRLAEALIGCLLLGALASGCGKTTPAAGTPASEPVLPVTGNPFVGAEFFNPPYSNADQARRRLLREHSPDAALIAKIADTPQARWFGDWSADVQIAVSNYVRAAHKQRKAALLVAYNIPNRDCGQYSSGGAEEPGQYRRWVRAFAHGIGPKRRAIVVLEPDALGHLTDCLSEADQEGRLELLRFAVQTLEALPGVSVYLDAGHARWLEPEEAASRLRRAGIEQARGFSLNVSNYIADAESIQYGNQVSALVADQPFIIDSSRNGNGPAAGSEWCNPEGRALGRRPTADTGEPRLDAYAWIKNPGESDGTCAGGPEAGRWFHARAVELARNASW